MPVFFARWNNGNFSIVSATDEVDAYVRLDEIADEPAQLVEIESCLVDFALTEHGTFRLSELGEDTATEILKIGYPRLRKALANEESEYVLADGQVDYPLGRETAKHVRAAAKFERERLCAKPIRRAKTVIGRAIQRKMGCSAVFADIYAARAREAVDEAKPAKKKRRPTKQKPGELL